MNSLLINLGLNPDVFLPILQEQLLEPFNILAALFVMLLPAPFGLDRLWVFVRLVLVLLVLYLIITLKLQLGLFPDVPITEMFKVIGPIGFVYWSVGLLLRFLMASKNTKPRIKTLLLVLATVGLFFAISVGFYNFPLGELATFAQHIIIGSPHAKLLLGLPLVMTAITLLRR